MKEKEYWIYGTHAVNAALKNPLLMIQRLLLVDNHSNKTDLMEQAKKRNILITLTKTRDLDTKLPQVNHQGVAIAIEPRSDFNENDLDALLADLTCAARLLVLDGVVDPHNLGACLRVADAAGVHAVIAPKDRACGLTPVVRKVACGAAESVPFIPVTNLARTLRCLKEQGIWLYGLAAEATQDYTQADFKSSIAIVMGAEGSGLRRITAECCDFLIRIPMLGCVESLNVSVATGIVLYEAVRQG